MPKFFVYPMQAGSIMRIGGFSAASILVYILPLVGNLLRLILWVIFLKYAFVVMERTANGRFDEPDNLDGTEEGGVGQVFRQFGVLLIFGVLFLVLILLFGTLGLALGWLMMNLLPPASMMIICVSRSMWQALNPFQIGFYIATIGLPYFALCFLLLSVTGGGAWVQGFLKLHMHSWLLMPLASFVEFYFTLITYHMMGYALYQYHDKLGVHAEVSFEQAEAAQSPNKVVADPALARLSVLIAEGKENEAIDFLREELRTKWENNDLHQRYQRLLQAAGASKQEVALEHAREFIGKLVTEKRLFQAMDIFEQSMKVDPEFRPRSPDQVYQLAAAAHMGKKYKVALDLMRGFDKRYPGHNEIPSVYFISAQILNEQFQAHKQAASILRALLAKFPDHPLVPQARQYLATLPA